MIDITIIDYSIDSQRLSRICRQLRKEGYPMNDDDVYRLSPLLREHINMLGRYSFSMPDAVAKGELRPLRNPEDANS
jgi:hypothetical protein